MGCTVAFFGILHVLGERQRFNGSLAFTEHVPVMFTPTLSSTLLLSMEHQSLMGI